MAESSDWQFITGNFAKLIIKDDFILYDGLVL
jgi:hypothetical protein